LAAYATNGNVSDSARAADIDRATHYGWLKDDPEYAALFADAKEDAIEAMESTARARARESSDVLMIFLLKSLRPAVYRDNYSIEHSGPAGKPIEIENRQSAQKFLTNPAALKLALEADRLTREAARLEGGGDAPPTA